MIDKSNLLGILDKFPEQCKEAIKTARKAKIKITCRINNVIICGIGADGAAADIAASLEKNVPIRAIKDYNVPRYVNKNTLAVIVSYSGEREIFSVYRSAKQKKANIVLITSNGKFARREKNSILIPAGLVPRLAVGHLLLSITTALEKAGVIPGLNYKKALSLLVPKTCSREGFMVSKKLKNKITLVYSSNRFKSIAERLKTMINSNAKQFAFCSQFPDLIYNELCVFKKTARKYEILIIRDKEEHPDIKKTIEIFKKLIKKKTGTTELYAKGDSLFAKLLHCLYVSDYISYYLALMHKEDPGPVQMISEFREKMHGR